MAWQRHTQPGRHHQKGWALHMHAQTTQTTHTHTQIYIHAQIQSHIQAHTSAHTHTHTHTYTHTHVHTKTYTGMHVHTHTHTTYTTLWFMNRITWKTLRHIGTSNIIDLFAHAHGHRHVHVRTDIHTRTHACTHTHAHGDDRHDAISWTHSGHCCVACKQAPVNAQTVAFVPHTHGCTLRRPPSKTMAIQLSIDARTHKITGYTRLYTSHSFSYTHVNCV